MTETPASRKIRPNIKVLTGVLLVLLGLGYGVYRITLLQAVPELARAEKILKSQKAEIKTLSKRLESSIARQKVAEQEARVMRQANSLLREEERNHQAELQRLAGELDFYRRLAGTSGAQSGLAVYHLELSPTGSGRVYRFVLTLTQNLRRSAITSGKVQFDLEGTLGDRPLTLPWARITDGNQPEPQFRFKYFQQLDGYLTLPDGFQPTRLLVSLNAKGQNKPVTRGFDWQDLTSNEPAAALPVNPTELEKELQEAQDTP